MQLNPDGRLLSEANFQKSGISWTRGSAGRWLVPAVMLVVDLVAAVAATCLAGMAAEYAVHGLPGAVGTILRDRLVDIPGLLVLLPALLAFGGLYSMRVPEPQEFKVLAQTIVIVAFVDLLIMGLPADPRAYTLVGTTWLLAGILLVSGRMCLRSLPVIQRIMTRHFLLIGGDLTPGELALQLRENRLGRASVVGTEPISTFVGKRPEEIRRLVELLAHNKGLSPSRVELLVAPTPQEWDLACNIIRCLEELDISAELALPCDGLARKSVQLRQPFGSDIVFASIQNPGEPVVQSAVKRLLDIALSLTALSIVAPLLLLIDIVIRLDGGPALFSQARVARDGRSFNLLKFRTMHVDAEAKLIQILSTDPRAWEEWQRHQKLAVDPRITPFGRFLRATSLDELPQLLNVLAGDMSLVGPRPIVAGNHCNHAGDAAYARSDDFRYYARFRPGITGLWQVSGRASTDYSERVRLDRWYARNWSLWLDAVILFKTVSALVNRTGT